MKPSDQIMLKALEKLETSELVVGKSIAEVYKGITASFGAVVIQSGILQACLAYHTGTTERKKLITLLFAIYKTVYEPQNSQDIQSYLQLNWADQWNEQQKRKFRKRMVTIAVSTKLAMRTFHFDKTLNDKKS